MEIFIFFKNDQYLVHKKYHLLTLTEIIGTYSKIHKTGIGRRHLINCLRINCLYKANSCTIAKFHIHQQTNSMKNLLIFRFY